MQHKIKDNMTKDDIEREINLLFKDAEKFSERCDTRLLNTLPDLRTKIESLEGTDLYDIYINKFYDIRDSFKLDCICGKKSRVESKEPQESESEPSKEDMSWFGTNLKERIEEVMEYHRKGVK